MPNAPRTTKRASFRFDTSWATPRDWWILTGCVVIVAGVFVWRVVLPVETRQTQLEQLPGYRVEQPPNAKS